MQVVCVSRGTFAGGKQLAERLASSLGTPCLSREEVSDAATGAGIPVGKLEMTVLRRRPLSEQLNIEKERFKAFVVATLSERAAEHGLVYHGRAAHLQLPGISHIMRVRAIMDPEMRTSLTMNRLRLSRDKARRYNDEVDEDRNRWVRSLYNVDWTSPEQYDLVLNLSQVNVDNAASVLVTMARLPEFQTTPADERALADLGLAAHCRLAIGHDPRTKPMDVQVKADRGNVLVTYLPRHLRLAPLIPEVLEKVDGIGEIVCTMASTNLLWIQERYDATSKTLDQVLDIAKRWDSAIELVQLTSSADADAKPSADVEMALLGETASREKDGGILDDQDVPENAYGDESVKQTMERLISVGRAGGHRRVCGGPKDLLGSLDRTAPYSLIVVGDMFLSKSDAVRKRMSSELVSYLNDNLKVPVVGAEDLKTQYSFGPMQWGKLLLAATATALLFGLVFTNQIEVLTFLSEEGTFHRVLATACVFAFVPTFAFCYGSFTRLVLRLFKFE